MNRSLVLLAGFLAGIFFTAAIFLLTAPPAPASCVNGSIQPVLSPGAEDEILPMLSSARASLDVMLYEFSYAGFKEALVAAASRGVRVRLLLDPKIDANLETADFLKTRGVQVRWSSQKFVYTHSKLAIADARCVLVGSINWSRHALFLNREAAIILCDSHAVDAFASVFEEDWAAATPA